MLTIGDFISLLKVGLGWKKAHALPSFEQIEFGGIPPEAIALTRDVGQLLTGDASQDLNVSRYLDDDKLNGWCHELRLRLRLKNKSSKMLSIVGISPNKQIVDQAYESAVLFPPQGAISGDVIRFECNLDSNTPSMKRFNLEGRQRLYSSSEYYFHEGILEIEPGSTICISILFQAENRAYEVFPELVLELNDRQESLRVPMKRRGIVCPAAFISDNAKYVRNYEPKPPFVEINPKWFNDCFESNHGRTS